MVRRAKAILYKQHRPLSCRTQDLICQTVSDFIGNVTSDSITPTRAILTAACRIPAPELRGLSHLSPQS